MGTLNANIATNQGTTDTVCRAFWQAIHDFLATTCGLTLTSDTGQANLATITRSAASFQERGYEVFKLGDALQATAPVFIRVGYCMGQSVSCCSVTFQIGFATDGAGNLTSSNKTPATNPAANLATGNSGTPDTTPHQAIGSGGTNRFCLAIGLDSTEVAGIHTGWVSLERTKDASGADTADGVLFGIGLGNGAVLSFTYLPASGSFQSEPALTAVGSCNTSSAVGAQVHMGRPIPLQGDMRSPGRNLMVFIDADFTNLGTHAMTVDGASHTYMTLSDLFASVAAVFGGTKAPNSRLALLFE